MVIKPNIVFSFSAMIIDCGIMENFDIYKEILLAS